MSHETKKKREHIIHPIYFNCSIELLCALDSLCQQVQPERPGLHKDTGQCVLSKEQISWLKNRMEDKRPEVRALAKEQYEMRFPPKRLEDIEDDFIE